MLSLCSKGQQTTQLALLHNGKQVDEQLFQTTCYNWAAAAKHVQSPEKQQQRKAHKQCALVSLQQQLQQRSESAPSVDNAAALLDDSSSSAHSARADTATAALLSTSSSAAESSIADAAAAMLGVRVVQSKRTAVVT